jgi:hypothetical protein
MLLYGCQLWDFESDSVNTFFVAWRKCIRQLFKIPWRTHNVLLNLICDDIPIEAQLHKRFIKFLVNIINSSNECVNICGNLALNGSCSQVSKSINYVCHQYGICKYKSVSNLMSIINADVASNIDENVYMTASIIQDFIAFKEYSSVYSAGMYTEDLNNIISYLCTS